MRSVKSAQQLARMAGVLIGGVTAAAVPAATLPLRHGTYVTDDFQGRCTDAPFASVSSYDGKGFGGPHSAQCSATILSHRGNRYRVTNVCRAQGDGTPLPTPDVDRWDIVIHSATAFTTFYRVGKNRYSYGSRYCPGY